MALLPLAGKAQATAAGRVYLSKQGLAKGSSSAQIVFVNNTGLPGIEMIIAPTIGSLSKFSVVNAGESIKVQAEPGLPTSLGFKRLDSSIAPPLAVNFPQSAGGVATYYLNYDGITTFSISTTKIGPPITA
jgi:hypothetical protein